MTELAEIQTRWTGHTPTSSITRMHFARTDAAAIGDADAQAAADTVRAFWHTLAPAIPVGESAEVQPLVPVVDDTDGVLIRDLTIHTVELDVEGTGTGGLTVGVGLRVSWSTDNIRFGRHIHGGSYLVPSAKDTFDAAGEPSATALSLLESAGSALITTAHAAGLDFVVWSRPNHAKSRTGGHSKVTAVVPDRMPSGLRRRRL